MVAQPPELELKLPEVVKRMKSLEELTSIVQTGLQLIKAEPDLIEGCVYASSNHRTVGRICYSSHIPSNGLEEPKSDEDWGVSVELWFKRSGQKLLGFGHEANEFSIEGIKRAIFKARRDAVADSEFHGFLKPYEFSIKQSKLPKKYHDDYLLNLTSEAEAKMLSKISWDTIAGALDTITEYSQNQHLTPNQAAFILNGDNFLIRERMALATTNGIYDSDESTVNLSFLTAMLERANSKGSAWGARIKLTDDLSPYEIGKLAALAAINGVGGKRIASNKYSVVFGHQAVTELFGSLLLSHVNLGMVDFGATIFRGKYGQQVASPLLTLYDDATLIGGPGSKRITCEGHPTGKTLLIEKGKLVGYLADSRTRNKLLGKPKIAKQLIGADPHEIAHAIAPQNGFRFARGGGRVAGASIGISATNLVVDSPTPLPPAELLKKVGDGIYIGRLWYTYPVGGYSSGVISGTAIADCYEIKNGKLTTPILPNTIRLVDNLNQMINNIIGIGNNQIPTMLWASDEITHAPWVAIANVNLQAINLKVE